MPWPTDHKAVTRERILTSAVKLFSARGFDNVTISHVMKEAQLTHGCFYAHFGSKHELYTEAITSILKSSMLTRNQEKSGDKYSNLHDFLVAYLSIQHVHQEFPPCPLAFLATDVASRDDEVKAAYTKIYHNLLISLNDRLNCSPSRRKRALAITALMIGGVAISRMLCDEQAMLDLLEACREYGKRLLDEA